MYKYGSRFVLPDCGELEKEIGYFCGGMCHFKKNVPYTFCLLSNSVYGHQSTFLPPNIKVEPLFIMTCQKLCQKLSKLENEIYRVQ